MKPEKKFLFKKKKTKMGMEQPDKEYWLPCRGPGIGWQLITT